MNELDSLKKEVSQIRWWHSIDLGNGIITPGTGQNNTLLNRIRLDQDLTGKTVVDIGAWDGFFSFEAEERGASRVLAIDSFCWDPDRGGSKDGFNLARKVLDSKVEDLEIEVLDISPERIGVFDIVLFLRVLYHMRHPLLALERVASVTGEKLILSTHLDMFGTRYPAMAFYPGSEIGPTVWWGPNIQAVEEMLKTVGFSRVELIYKQSLLRRLGGALLNVNRSALSLFRRLNQGRAVFHAWK